MSDDIDKTLTRAGLTYSRTKGPDGKTVLLVDLPRCRVCNDSVDLDDNGLADWHPEGSFTRHTQIDSPHPSAKTCPGSGVRPK